MAAEQLPAAAHTAITRAAVSLIKAARAGVDDDVFVDLVHAQMAALHRAWTPQGVTGVDLLGALIAAQARIGAHLAGLADDAPGGPAARYLDELGGLAAQRTE